MGPLRKLNLRHQLWFYPVHFSERIHIAGKGSLLGLQFLQFLPDLLQRHLVETSPGLSHMNQLPFLVIETQYQGSEVLAASLGIGIPADYAVEGLRDLDFEPLAGAALFIDAASPLGQ